MGTWLTNELWSAALLAVAFVTIALIARCAPEPKDRPGSFWVEGDDQ